MQWIYGWRVGATVLIACSLQVNGPAACKHIFNIFFVCIFIHFIILPRAQNKTHTIFKLTRNLIWYSRILKIKRPKEYMSRLQRWGWERCGRGAFAKNENKGQNMQIYFFYNSWFVTSIIHYSSDSPTIAIRKTTDRSTKSGIRR